MVDFKYFSKMFQMSLQLTVRLRIKSPLRQAPFGGCSPPRSADSGVVSMILIPRLVAQVTPAPRYVRALPHRPPVYPSSFTSFLAVPVAGKDSTGPHRKENDCTSRNNHNQLVQMSPEARNFRLYELFV